MFQKLSLLCFVNTKRDEFYCVKVEIKFVRMRTASRGTVVSRSIALSHRPD